MKLHFAPNSRAGRIVWLFEELGLEYEINKMAFHPKDLKSDEHRKRPYLPVETDGFFGNSRSDRVTGVHGEEFRCFDPVPVDDCIAECGYASWVVLRGERQRSLVELVPFGKYAYAFFKPHWQGLDKSV